MDTSRNDLSQPGAVNRIASCVPVLDLGAAAGWANLGDTLLTLVISALVGGELG